MSPAAYLVAAWSMKREVKLLFFTFFILCMIPVFTVIVVTQAGITLVSDTLTSISPITSLVEIHDPRDGSIVYTLEQSRIWPTGGYVSLEFSERSPYQPFHTGIDIASPTGEVGDPVGAFMPGKVVYAGETSWGFGKHVEIDHVHHITTIYAHLDSIAVTKGQEVELGTIVGTLGDTGWSTGPHLHFQINVYGIPVNPRTFLTGDPPQI